MTEQVQTDKSRVRSAAYPSLSLEEAVKAITSLRDNAGEGPFSRLHASESLGHKGISGASSSKIAALVHFGLLSRIGDTYRVSDLARKIIRPEYDAERLEAIAAAAKHPKLYSELMNEFSGKSIPVMLENTLERRYRISGTVVKSVANDFVKSLEFAGLIVNGVLQDTNIDPQYKAAGKDEKGEEIDRNSARSGRSLNDRHNLDSSDSRHLHFADLPSGLLIGFTDKLRYPFFLGEFAGELKALEAQAQEILAGDTGGSNSDFNELQEASDQQNS